MVKNTSAFPLAIRLPLPNFNKNHPSGSGLETGILHPCVSDEPKSRTGLHIETKKRAPPPHPGQPVSPSPHLQPHPSLSNLPASSSTPSINCVCSRRISSARAITRSLVDLPDIALFTVSGNSPRSRAMRI